MKKNFLNIINGFDKIDKTLYIILLPTALSKVNVMHDIPTNSISNTSVVFLGNNIFCKQLFKRVINVAKKEGINFSILSIGTIKNIAKELATQ